MNLKLQAIIAAAAVLAAGAAAAGAIPVANGGFETPVVSGAVPGSFTAWQAGANAGVMNNNARNFTAPGGSQVGYAGGGYGILFQDVGAVTTGGTYTLTLDVGAAPASLLSDYRLLLGVWGPGGHDLATATIFAVAYDPVAITPGSWATVSLTGVATGLSGGLVIFLENSNAIGFGTQAGFDNVGLSSPAPAPASWAELAKDFA